MNLNHAIDAITVNALVNWSGAEDKEAYRTIAEESIKGLTNGEKLEKIGGITSVYSGINKLYEVMHNEEEFYLDKDEFLNEINNNADSFSKKLQDDFNTWFQKQNDPYHGLQLAVNDALELIHDNWIIDNGKKILRQGKEYQFAPLHFIGSKEAISDRVFVDSIVQSLIDNCPDPRAEKMTNVLDEKFYTDEYNKRQFKLLSSLIHDGLEKMLENYEPIKKSFFELKDGEEQNRILSVYEYMKENPDIYERMSESIRDKYLNNPIPELEKFIGKVYDEQIEVTFNCYDVKDGSFYLLKELDKKGQEKGNGITRFESSVELSKEYKISDVVNKAIESLNKTIEDCRERIVHLNNEMGRAAAFVYGQ